MTLWRSAYIHTKLLVNSSEETTVTPEIEAFFHEPTNTVYYVVSDPETGVAAIIDSVLDYDMSAGRTATHHADGVLAYIAEKGLKVDWILVVVSDPQGLPTGGTPDLGSILSRQTCRGRTTNFAGL